MSVVDNIATVEADETKTPAEKRALIYALKTGALLPFLQAREGQSWSKGNLTVTLIRAWEKYEGGLSWLCVHIVATRDGVRVAVNNPIMFRNPPVGDGSNAQLLQIAQDIVAEVLGG